MTAVFGKAGKFSFRPSVDEGQTLLTPASIVSASLYLDKPTQAQIDDDSNALSAALQHVTSWTDGLEEAEKLIDYTAITDPDPTSTDDERIYYYVVRYRLESGASILRDLEPFVVQRPEGIQYSYGIDDQDLYQVEPKLEQCAMHKAPSAIELAEMLVEKDLIASGLKIDRVNLKDCGNLVRYKAVSILCMGESYEENDSWWVKSEKHESTYEMLKKALVIGYDSNKDGVIEKDEELKAVSNMVYIGL